MDCRIQRRSESTVRIENKPFVISTFQIRGEKPTVFFFLIQVLSYPRSRPLGVRLYTFGTRTGILYLSSRRRIVARGWCRATRLVLLAWGSTACKNSPLDCFCFVNLCASLIVGAERLAQLAGDRKGENENGIVLKKYFTNISFFANK